MTRGMTWAISIGALAGLIYGLGESGAIRDWKGKAGEVPALLRLGLVGVLAGLAAIEAGTWRGTLVLGLWAIGAAKLADLAARTGVELVRAARRA